MSSDYHDNNQTMFFSLSIFLKYQSKFKGTVMKIEKAPINDHLRFFKIVLKISHSNYL